MPRPKRKRKMINPPSVRGYRPIGTSKMEDHPVKLLYEEYEALRLADYENMSQVEAAELMDVSRPTFTRIYDRALKKIAQALNESRSFIIEGGNIQFQDQWYRCHHCYSVYKSNKKVQPHCAVCGSSELEHINPTVEETLHAGHQCVCEQCGHTERQQKEVPCREFQCPECGHLMRKEAI